MKKSVIAKFLLGTFLIPSVMSNSATAVVGGKENLTDTQSLEQDVQERRENATDTQPEEQVVQDAEENQQPECRQDPAPQLPNSPKSLEEIRAELKPPRGQVKRSRFKFFTLKFDFDKIVKETTGLSMELLEQLSCRIKEISHTFHSPYEIALALYLSAPSRSKEELKAFHSLSFENKVSKLLEILPKNQVV